MDRFVAVYVRVSSRRQDTRSQEPDLHRWVDAYADAPVVWYRDKFTGKTMDRPGWRRLEADMVAGKVSKIVVWRLDRLGRTAAGLTALMEDLQRRHVGFEALRDKIDLSTAAGRLMANVLASVAAYEKEVRSERIRAGQAVARANGKRWGGSRKGRRLKVTPEQVEAIGRLKGEGAKIAAISIFLGRLRTCARAEWLPCRRSAVRPEWPKAKRHIPFWALSFGDLHVPRLVGATPKYRRHKASGQAIMTIQGRDFYLGPWNSKAGKVEYDRIISEWPAAGRRIRPEGGESDLTIVEVLARHKRSCRTTCQSICDLPCQGRR